MTEFQTMLLIGLIGLGNLALVGIMLTLADIAKAIKDLKRQNKGE